MRQQFYPDGGSSRLKEDSTHFGRHPLTQHQRNQLTGDDPRAHDGQAPMIDAERHEQQHKAVARVSMWVQRGNCPHMVESTALLMAALLSDEEQMCNTTTTAAVADLGRVRSGLDNSMASSSYAIRAAYSTAFSR